MEPVEHHPATQDAPLALTLFQQVEVAAAEQDVARSLHRFAKFVERLEIGFHPSLQPFQLDQHVA
ncbi:hypothetical protein D3C78_1875810 [compost metagenome]